MEGMGQDGTGQDSGAQSPQKHSASGMEKLGVACPCGMLK